MKKTLFLVTFLLMVGFISCKKDKTASSAIDGTYTFKGLYALTISDISVPSTHERAVTTTEYTTTDNGGTVVFNKGKMTSKDLTYSIDTEANYDYYLDGALEDQFTVPFEFTLPPTSSAGSYKIIGQDSIYFPSSTIFAGADPSGMQGGASGGRFSFDGNLLTIMANIKIDKVVTQSGVTGYQTQTVNTKIFLEKQ